MVLLRVYQSRKRRKVPFTVFSQRPWPAYFAWLWLGLGGRRGCIAAPRIRASGLSQFPLQCVLAETGDVPAGPSQQAMKMDRSAGDWSGNHWRALMTFAGLRSSVRHYDRRRVARILQRDWRLTTIVQCPSPASMHACMHA